MIASIIIALVLVGIIYHFRSLFEDMYVRFVLLVHGLYLIRMINHTSKRNKKECDELRESCRKEIEYNKKHGIVIHRTPEEIKKIEDMIKELERSGEEARRYRD